MIIKKMNINNGVVFLILLAVITTACDDHNNENNSLEQQIREVVVETIRVEPQTFDEIIQVTGTVEAVEDAIISAEVSGRVQSIVERGTRVEKGEIIVNLDDRLVRSSLEVAQSNYALAEDAYQRQKPLLRDSIISTLSYNQARAQRDQAKSQLEQAQKQLGDSRIEAPFSGVIEERMVNAGELVNPGIPVLRLVNTGRIRINAGVPERYINDIHKGSPATIHLKSYGGDRLQSEVEYVGSLIVPETRTFPVEVKLQNHEGILKPEMVVNLEISRKVWEDALLVPRTALFRDENGFQLYVVGRDGDRSIAETRRVMAGVSSGALIMIEEGLEPGDEIIVTGHNSASNGDQLRIQGRHRYDRYQQE